MRLDLVGEIMNIDDDGFDSGLDELVEIMVEQGLSARADQRFRTVIRQRAHPRAETRRQQHRVGDPHRSVHASPREGARIREDSLHTTSSALPRPDAQGNA